MVKEVLSNKHLISILKEMRKKANGGVIADVKERKRTQSPSKTQHKDESSLDASKKKEGQAAGQRDRVMSARSSKKIKQPEKCLNEVDKAQPSEPVPMDWFKDYLVVTEHDEERAKAIEKQLNQIKLTDEKVDRFFSEEINSMSYQDYEEMLQVNEVRDKIAVRLSEGVNGKAGLKNESIKEISNYIRHADKDLFLKLKDGKYTLD